MFGLSVRLCFGDGVVDEHLVGAMEHEVRRFLFTFLEDSALLLASGSRSLAWLLHWRRWLRYSGTFPRLYKLILPTIAARRRSRSRRAAAASSRTGINTYVDTLLDLRVPDDMDGKGKRPLTDREMVKLVLEFLGANTKSVVSCVEWTLALLVAHPEAQKKLHREITGDEHDHKGLVVVSEERLHSGLPYLRAIIVESLRLHGPVLLIMRDVSARDAAVCGAPAPADGAPVRLVIKVGDVGRSRKAWTDPDEFHPERFLAGGEAEGVGPVPGPKEIRMVPFRAGRRYCPGERIGMAHVASFLAGLVCEFEWALPADGHGIDTREHRNFFMVMKTPLRARVTRHARLRRD